MTNAFEKIRRNIETHSGHDSRNILENFTDVCLCITVREITKAIQLKINIVNSYGWISYLYKIILNQKTAQCWDFVRLYKVFQNCTQKLWGEVEYIDKNHIRIEWHIRKRHQQDIKRHTQQEYKHVLTSEADKYNI